VDGVMAVECTHQQLKLRWKFGTDLETKQEFLLLDEVWCAACRRTFEFDGRGHSVSKDRRSMLL
jgi:hypothetical protein